MTQSNLLAHRGRPARRRLARSADRGRPVTISPRRTRRTGGKILRIDPPRSPRSPWSSPGADAAVVVKNNANPFRLSCARRDLANRTRPVLPAAAGQKSGSGQDSRSGTPAARSISRDQVISTSVMKIGIAEADFWQVPADKCPDTHGTSNMVKLLHCPGWAASLDRRRDKGEGSEDGIDSVRRHGHVETGGRVESHHGQ
jgi:hypothetical protein